MVVRGGGCCGLKAPVWFGPLRDEGSQGPTPRTGTFRKLITDGKVFGKDIADDKKVNKKTFRIA